MVSSEICPWPNACRCIPYLSPCMATNMNHKHLRFTQVDHSPTSKKTNCSLSPVMGELQIWSESYGWYQPEWSSSVVRSPRIPSINSTSIALHKARLGFAAFRPPQWIYSHAISQLVGWFSLRSIIPVTPDWSRYLFHPDVWTFILRKLLKQWDMKSLVKSLIDKYQFGHLFPAIQMVSIYGWWIPIDGIPMVISAFNLHLWLINSQPSHLTDIYWYGGFLKWGIPSRHNGCFNTKPWSSMTWMIAGGTTMTWHPRYPTIAGIAWCSF